MFNKNNLFNRFTKQQKSALCHSVKSFVKKNLDKSNILDCFIQNETYYIEIGASRLHFIENFLEDPLFIKDLKLYTDDCVKYYNYQKSLEPFKNAQKEILKEQRKKAQEFKMSKEPPTKRQLSYYVSLCKKFNLNIVDTKELSKLDLRNMIREIKNEYQRD